MSGSNGIARLYTGAAYLRTKPAGEQLAIRYDDRGWADHEGTKLLRQIGRAVSLIGHKQAAYDLGLTESVLSNMIAQRGRHYFRAEHLPYLVAKSPDDELAHALVAPGGYVADRPPEMTAEERLERLERTLGEHLGAELRTALLERAYRGQR